MLGVFRITQAFDARVCRLKFMYLLSKRNISII